MIRASLLAVGLLVWIAALGLAGAVGAYPGGTPYYQTDVSPYCAGCHSSITEDALAGAGARAQKELVASKHLAPIQKGEGHYAKLSPADRETLVQHIEAVDASSKIALVDYPPQVKVGEVFNLTVLVTGGAGPTVGVALVDRAHRWFAKPASTIGWSVVGAPTVIGPDGKPQSAWLERRPERMGRGLSFVNIAEVESDVVAGKYAKSKVIFRLKAPDKPGDYALVGAYFYGTEKATPLGSSVHSLTGKKEPLGGYEGKSGRVKFSESLVISVK
jgi:hypothetical protein